MTRAFVIGAAVVLVVCVPAAAQDTFGGSGQNQPPPPQQGQWNTQPPPPPQQGQWNTQPQPGPGNGGADLDQLMQMERQDFGVQPTSQLHTGQPHGPTPASIPGGQVITTKGLVALIQGQQAPHMVFDVLGGPHVLPGAIPAVFLAQPGSFNDPISQQFGQMLSQASGGRKDVPLVFYCLSTQCWMSYNAALRAINLGYTNVLWYRGGIEAWQMAGLPTQPAQQFGPGAQPQGPQGPQQQVPQSQPQYPQPQPQYPQQQSQFPQQQGGWPSQ